VGGKLFFFRDDSMGNALWATDGSEEGTQLVKEMGPNFGNDPYGLTILNGKVYFMAYDGYWGVWVSDGTEAGTQLVKRTCPIYHGGCLVNKIKANGNKLYFQVFDFDSGTELWAVDAIGDSAYLVKDINPTGSSSPYELTNYNDKIYFSADDGVHGSELWTSDGTAEGTLMVKDINPSGLSFPNTFTTYHGKLFFMAQDSMHGWELWNSDGTEAGTLMVKDANPAGNLYCDSFITYNDLLYFRGEDSYGKVIWVTDGTAEGTHKVEPAPQFNANPLLTYPHWFVYNEALFMGAEYDSAGKELWKIATAPSGLEDFQQSSVSVYPNPVHKSLTISGIAGEFDVSIKDITGRCFLSRKACYEHNPVDIQSFEPGLYIISVTQSGRVKTIKFIKI